MKAKTDQFTRGYLDGLTHASRNYEGEIKALRKELARSHARLDALWSSKGSLDGLDQSFRLVYGEGVGPEVEAARRLYKAGWKDGQRRLLQLAAQRSAE